MTRLICWVMMVLAFPASLLAQDETDPWPRRMAERFQPVTADQREAIEVAVPERAAMPPKSERRILVFYRCEGFIHTSIPHANVAAECLGKKTGAFKIDLADTYDVFTPENLANYDAILLNSPSKLVFPQPSQLNAFLDFIAGGKGLIGFHAASDNFDRHPQAIAMVGGLFNGHPWGAGGTWAFKLDDPDHPLNQAFQGTGFWCQDEIYQYHPDSYLGTEKLRVLVSLDMSKETVSGRIEDGPREVPVSWIHQAGKGRVFYTNFGHREETYRNPAIMKHMLDGIQYALGDFDVDDTATAKSDTKTPALAAALDPVKP